MILGDKYSIDEALYQAEKKGKKVHNLKVETTDLILIAMCKKNFEIRKNDQNYEVGDWLLLQSENDTTAVLKEVRYIFQGGKCGLDENYVILSIR